MASLKEMKDCENEPGTEIPDQTKMNVDSSFTLW